MNGRKKPINREMSYFFCLLLAMTGCCGFYSYLPGGLALYSKDYIFVLTFLVALLFGVIQIVKSHKLIYASKYLKLGVVLVLIIVIEVILTYIRIKQPIILIIKEGFYYIVPIICYLTFLQYKNKGSLKQHADMIVGFSLVCSAIAIVSFLLFNLFQLDILNLRAAGIVIRNGTIRFQVGGAVMLTGIIISFTRILGKTNSRLDFINVIAGMFHIIAIYKTRTVIFYMLVTVAIYILMQKRFNKLLRGLIILAIIVLMVLAVVSTDTINTSIAGYLNADAGVLMRYRAIEFYMNQFYEHPIFGMGLISSSTSINGWQLLYGPEGRFYRSDVGIIGVLNALGIVGLIWVIYFFTIIYKALKSKKDGYALMIKSITNYLLVSMVNLAFLSSSSFVMFICLVFVMMYLYEHIDTGEHETKLY